MFRNCSSSSFFTGKRHPFNHYANIIKDPEGRKEEKY